MICRKTLIMRANLRARCTIVDPSSKPSSATYLYLPIPDNLCSQVSVETSCNHLMLQSSSNPISVWTVSLPKHDMALLNNPPTHSIAILLDKYRCQSHLLVADNGATDHMLPEPSSPIGLLKTIASEWATTCLLPYWAKDQLSSQSTKN
jgi:hypothetical protein